MKSRHVSRFILLLIFCLLVRQAMERHEDLECYINPHADRHQFAYDQGLATDQEIRLVVWNDVFQEFNGQPWRVMLDNVYHTLFMGGSRPDLVVKQLQNPVGEDWWIVTCEGGIRWSVRDNRDRWPKWYSADTWNSESANDVTVALHTIPKEELQHYSIKATEYIETTVYNDDGYTEISERRDAGETSAEAWLAGQIVPKYWSTWHNRWQQRENQLQAVDDEAIQ